MSQYLRLSFIVVILCLSKAYANPNTDLQDVSPTHLQLFQLSQITTNIPENGEMIRRDDRPLPAEIAKFIADSMTAYQVFINTHHRSDNLVQDYRASAEQLIDLMYPIRTKDNNKYPVSVPLQNHKALLLDAIENEVLAAQQGQCIFWRYEFDYGWEDDPTTCEKSFSAPGLLAGILYDGLGAYMNKNDGYQSGGACTFIYAANVIMKRFFNTREGYAYLYQHAQDVLATVSDTETALQPPSPDFTYDETDQYERAAWATGLATTIFQFIQNKENKFRQLAMAPFDCRNRTEKNLSGRLYGIQIAGTYTNNQVKRLDPYPTMLCPQKGIFGGGEAFHPRFREKRISNFTVVNLSMPAFQPDPVKNRLGYYLALK